MSKAKVQQVFKATHSIRVFPETYRRLKILAARRGETLSMTIHELTSAEKLSNELVAILSEHCGETGKSEGAVETLKRILREHSR